MLFSENAYNELSLAACLQVLMKDAVTRKKIFVIPRADSFDQMWTVDVQSNGELSLFLTNLSSSRVQGGLCG